MTGRKQAGSSIFQLQNNSEASLHIPAETADSVIAVRSEAQHTLMADAVSPAKNIIEERSLHIDPLLLGNLQVLLSIKEGSVCLTVLLENNT